MIAAQRGTGQPPQQALHFQDTYPVSLASAYASAIEDANLAAAEGRQHDWMWHLNLYLEHYNRGDARRSATLAPNPADTPLARGASPHDVLHLRDRPGPLLSRLVSKPLAPAGDGGPLVSVIMVAFNAEATLEYAATSILRQTWRSLELIIVDDASTDSTRSLMQALSDRDPRVKLVHNAVQVGPYISRNRVLNMAAGAYITTQDADDWALPRRLETQVRAMVDSKGTVRANMMHMLRLQESGAVSTASPSSFSPDGAARQAFVSAMYEAALLREDLGYWDSVLYGGDGELIRRAQKLLGSGFTEIRAVGIFLADRSNSLGKQGYRVSPDRPRDPSNGWAGSSREAYRTAYDAWHQKTEEEDAGFYMDFPLYDRPFPAPAGMGIDTAHVCACLLGTELECVGG